MDLIQAYMGLESHKPQTIFFSRPLTTVHCRIAGQPQRKQETRKLGNLFENRIQDEKSIMSNLENAGLLHFSFDSVIIRNIKI